SCRSGSCGHRQGRRHALVAGPERHQLRNEQCHFVIANEIRPLWLMQPPRLCSAWLRKPGGDPRREEVMLTGLGKLAGEEAGQDLAEYGIALAVIGIIAAAAAIVIAKDVGTLWSQAQNVISSATNAATS